MSVMRWVVIALVVVVLEAQVLYLGYVQSKIIASHKNMTVWVGTLHGSLDTLNARQIGLWENQVKVNKAVLDLYRALGFISDDTTHQED